MPINNNLIITKENYKKTEIVQELKDEYKVPSFEEFDKTYEPSEEVEILTEAEYQDRLLHGPQFGPGSQQSRETAKTGTAVGVAVLTVVCPPAGLAVGGGLLGGGAALTALGSQAPNEEDGQELMDFGKSMMTTGVKGIIGGVDKLGTHSGKDCSLPICPKKP
jgi:hypothetical protein